MADVSPTPNPTPAGAAVPPEKATARRGMPPSSIFFFALSILLGILAILLATGRIGTSSPPPPPPTPGDMEEIHVIEALRAQGLAAESEPGLFVPSGAFGEPGQGVRVEGEPLYVFYFDDPEQARAAFAAADPAAVLPPPRGADAAEVVGADPVGVSGGDPFLVQGSNVIVAMAGGDEATRSKVRIAIEGLP